MTRKPKNLRVQAGLSSSVGYLLILFDYFSIISFPADAQAWQTCTAIGEGSEAPKAAPGDTEGTLGQSQQGWLTTTASTALNYLIILTQVNS